MTREQLFAQFGWQYIFMILMVVNALAMTPQIKELRKSKNSAGITPRMFWIYLVCQFGSMIEGIRVASPVLFWGMIAAMAFTIWTLALIYRYTPKGA
jgi:uncharacterized protein with PQ loop repeat